MEKLRYSVFFTVIISTLVSCNLDPEPIRYGEDACHFCEMTIVSQAHAARAVSTKGKQFKYDAIECMVHDLIKNETQMAVQQVSDFSNPGTMMAVDQALFIINDSINSPMGANLAALKKKEKGSEKDLRNLLTWNQLKAHFRGENSVTTKELE